MVRQRLGGPTRGQGVRLLAVALVVASTACASLPKAPDRTSVAAGLAAGSGTTVSAFRAVEAPGLPPGITLDDSLSLDEAVATALWNNPEFLAALGSLDIARADLIQAGLLKNPILSLLFPLGPKQFESAINWSVDALWQRPKRIEDARLNVEAVASELVAHGLGLAADVKVAYVDVLAAERAAAIVTSQASIASQMAALTDGRLRLGDVSELDTRLARLDATRLQAFGISRVAERDRAYVRLRALLGLPAGTPPLKLVEPPAAFSLACGARVDGLTKAALAARPDVRAAELRVESAGARLGLERSKIVALTATIDMNGQGREGFEAGPGLAVEVPVLSQNNGARARAAAEVTMATRRYQAVAAAVANEVETAFVTFEEARARQIVLGADLGVSIDRERQQVERLFEAGEISLLTLLEARQRLGDVDLLRQEAGLASARARARLEQALGQPCPAR